MGYIYKVSEINRRVKQYLEGNASFRNMIIEGELSGVTYYRSGHLYFQLKDESSQVKCAAFSYQRRGIPSDLKEGEKVRVFADVGFYENRGDFQLLVRGIEKQNSLGKMFAELEALKTQLKAAGYFSLEHKRPLPPHPKKIGVVTALTGAALQDIIKTVRKRDPRIDIYVCSARVQGKGAEEDIVNGIDCINQVPDLDFIIAGRGGGSVEDLWAFNKKEVGMAFYNSHYPIISAVGHEVDVLLSDYLADVRAATPTQAAELSVPELSQYEEQIAQRQKRLAFAMERILLAKRRDWEARRQNYSLQAFPKSFDAKRQEILMREASLQRALKTLWETKAADYQRYYERLLEVNPLRILEKGYAVLSKKKKRIVSISAVEVGDQIEIRMAGGSCQAEIKEKNVDENESDALD